MEDLLRTIKIGGQHYAMGGGESKFNSEDSKDKWNFTANEQSGRGYLWMTSRVGNEECDRFLE